MASGMYPYQHFFGEPTACIQIPHLPDREALSRWKLPREVFRDMFVRRTNKLAEIDTRTARTSAAAEETTRSPARRWQRVAP